MPTDIHAEDRESVLRMLTAAMILTLTALLRCIYNLLAVLNWIYVVDEPVKFSTVIQPWGNSLGLRITRPMGQMARIRKGSRVTVEVVKEGLLVKIATPLKKPLKLPYSEAQLVRGLTPRKAHADELPAPLVSELEL